MQVKATFDFEPMAEGTRLAISSEVEGRGLFSLADPVLSSILRHQMTSDLEVLRTLLEAPDGVLILLADKS